MFTDVEAILIIIETTIPVLEAAESRFIPDKRRGDAFLITILVPNVRFARITKYDSNDRTNDDSLLCFFLCIFSILCFLKGWMDGWIAYMDDDIAEHSTV